MQGVGHSWQEVPEICAGRLERIAVSPGSLGRKPTIQGKRLNLGIKGDRDRASLEDGNLIDVTGFGALLDCGYEALRLRIQPSGHAETTRVFRLHLHQPARAMPKPPKELIEEALSDLAAALEYTEAPSPASHSVIEVDGFGSPNLTPALARYAVALLTGWVQKDATIAELLGITGVEHREEVRLLVDTVIGPPEGASATALIEWKQRSRNAWLAEVMTHALFVIHRTATSPFVGGGVAAVLQPHPKPTRQGLDSVAIYEEATLAIVAIGETKASGEHGSAMLTRACDIFDEIDRGIFGPDLRSALGLLADVLPPHLKSQIGESLWRRERCYLPTIYHEVAFDASAERSRLKRLHPKAERKRVVVCRISDFEQFFDRVAEKMPSAIEELVV